MRGGILENPDYLWLRAIEGSVWRKCDGKRKALELKQKACEQKDWREEKVMSLSVLLYVVLTEGEKKRMIRQSRFTRDYMSPDMDLYCQYHKAKGLDTEDCHQLRNENECLIREGHSAGIC